MADEKIELESPNDKAPDQEKYSSASEKAAEAAARMAPNLELESDEPQTSASNKLDGGEGLLPLGNISADSGNSVVGYLRVQFVDVYKQLELINEASSLAERNQISAKIRSWINALNTSGLIPLDFRVRTLRMLAKFLDVLTGEMRSVILSAYKVGVQQTYDQMRQATEKAKEIDTDMVDNFAEICCVALELLVGYIIDEARHNRTPSPLESRQALEIIWMGLSVIQGWPVDRRNRSRIMRAAIQFELMRKIDFLSLSKRDIDRLPELLKQLVEMDDIDIRAVRVLSDYKAVTDNTYLVSLLMKSHQRPQVYKTSLPASHEGIIIDFSAVLRLAKKRIDDVRKRLEVGGENGLILESEYEEARFLTRILEGFNVTKARDKRVPINGEVVLVCPGILLEFSTARFVSCAGINASEDGILIDISDMPEGSLSVGSIATLRRPNINKHDVHAVVRWIRHSTSRGTKAGFSIVPRSDYTALVTIHTNKEGQSQTVEPGFVVNREKEPFEVWVQSSEDIPGRVYATINPASSYPPAFTAILERQKDESNSYRRFRVLKKDPSSLPGAKV